MTQQVNGEKMGLITELPKKSMEKMAKMGQNNSSLQQIEEFGCRVESGLTEATLTRPTDLFSAPMLA